MSEPGFREIHLSGKHVVFLFMATVVAAVAFFLLGVSVGKGIAKPDAASAQMTPPPAGTGNDGGTGTPPDDTKPKQGELQAFNALQEKSAPKPSASPAAPTPAAAVVASPSPSPSPSPKSSPVAASAKPDPAPASGRYYVLVDSFSSLQNANNQQAELKKKGYTAMVYTVKGNKVPYKVRLGPYPDEDAAKAMAARLRKEGYKPSVTR